LTCFALIVSTAKQDLQQLADDLDSQDSISDEDTSHDEIDWDFKRKILL
jgi:hypothetical protein